MNILFDLNQNVTDENSRATTTLATNSFRQTTDTRHALSKRICTEYYDDVYKGNKITYYLKPNARVYAACDDATKTRPKNISINMK